MAMFHVCTNKDVGNIIKIYRDKISAFFLKTDNTLDINDIKKLQMPEVKNSYYDSHKNQTYYAGKSVSHCGACMYRDSKPRVELYSNELSAVYRALVEFVKMNYGDWYNPLYKELLVVAVLAHEIAHSVRYIKGMEFANVQEKEQDANVQALAYLESEFDKKELNFFVNFMKEKFLNDNDLRR